MENQLTPAAICFIRQEPDATLMIYCPAHVAASGLNTLYKATDAAVGDSHHHLNA
jgi:hypothetical protein